MLRTLVPPLLLCACAGDPSVDVPTPLAGVEDAFELAGEVVLPDRAARAWSDQQNVYRLSENVISGGEPLSPAAFARLAAWGVRTVVSVDGKAPDAASAAEHGMRVVHVPIRYSGLGEEQVLHLSKSFRELEPPFYVHCFHGQHRGPAAAALGRLVLDGAPRQRVIAEMRQWCGTSPKYAGLFHSLATVPVPDVARTAAHEFGFPAAATFDGMRDTMAAITRGFESLELLADGGFAPDAEHPDLVPAEEAKQVVAGFVALVGLAEVRTGPADQVRWMGEALAESRALLAALEANDAAGADTALGELSATCAACHRAYRNR